MEANKTNETVSMLDVVIESAKTKKKNKSSKCFGGWFSFKDINLDTLNKLEKDVKDRLDKFMAYTISMEQLLKEIEEKKKTFQRDSLIAQINKLSEEQKKELLQMVN